MDTTIGHFLQGFDEKLICSDVINQLKQIDERRNSEYLLTLKTYLDKGLQQTSTAASLNIHRSTLMYRLEKIQEMTEIDLSDPDTRLFLQISFKLQERKAYSA